MKNFPICSISFLTEALKNRKNEIPCAPYTEFARRANEKENLEGLVRFATLYSFSSFKGKGKNIKMLNEAFHLMNDKIDKNKVQPLEFLKVCYRFGKCLEEINEPAFASKCLKECKKYWNELGPENQKLVENEINKIEKKYKTEADKVFNILNDKKTREKMKTLCEYYLKTKESHVEEYSRKVVASRKWLESVLSFLENYSDDKKEEEWLKIKFSILEMIDPQLIPITYKDEKSYIDFAQKYGIISCSSKQKEDDKIIIEMDSKFKAFCTNFGFELLTKIYLSPCLLPYRELYQEKTFKILFLSEELRDKNSLFIRDYSFLLNERNIVKLKRICTSQIKELIEDNNWKPIIKFYLIDKSLKKKERKLVLFLTQFSFVELKQNSFTFPHSFIKEIKHEGLEKLLKEEKDKKIYLIAEFVNPKRNDGFVRIAKENCCSICGKEDGEPKRCEICDILFSDCEIKNDIKFCESCKIERNEHKKLHDEIFKYYTDDFKKEIIRRSEFDFSNGEVGLVNLGNTCFMNAGFQCIFHSEDLVKYIVKETYKNDGLDKEDYPLTEELKNTLEKIWFGTSSYYSPKSLRREFVIKESKFDNYAQHDSPELIVDFLNTIGSELNRANVCQYVIGFGETEEEKFMKKFFNKENSIINTIFYGFTKNRYFCRNEDCLKEKFLFEPFLLLSVPLKNREGDLDIEECFEEFRTNPNLTTKCYKCGNKLSLETTFIKLPMILIVHLKRFYQSEDFYLKKNYVNVIYQEELILEENKESVKYELFGVDEHHGSLNGGHYTAKCKVKGNWKNFNDDSVSDASSYHSSNALVLVYKRVKL